MHCYWATASVSMCGCCAPAAEKYAISCSCKTAAWQRRKRVFKKLLTKFATKQRCWKVQQGNKSGASDSGGWRVAGVVRGGWSGGCEGAQVQLLWKGKHLCNLHIKIWGRGSSVRTNVCIRKFVYARVYVFVYSHMCVYAFICIYIYMHVCLRPANADAMWN